MLAVVLSLIPLYIFTRALDLLSRQPPAHSAVRLFAAALALASAVATGALILAAQDVQSVVDAFMASGDF